MASDVVDLTSEADLELSPSTCSTSRGVPAGMPSSTRRRKLQRVIDDSDDSDFSDPQLVELLDQPPRSTKFNSSPPTPSNWMSAMASAKMFSEREEGRSIVTHKKPDNCDWLTEFKPKTFESLAIHKKKKLELDRWFLQAKRMFGRQRGQKKLLIISGPPGCCKSAAVEVFVVL